MYFSFRVSKIEPFEDNIGENMNAFELGWQNGGILQRKEYEIISNEGRINRIYNLESVVSSINCIN